MKKTSYIVTLDLHKTGTQAILNAKTKEVNSREVRILLTESGKPFPIEGGTARIYAELPDGKGKRLYDVTAYDQGAIVFAIPSELVSIKGNVNLEVSLTSGGTLYTPKFRLVVEESLADESAIEASNEFSALQKALNTVNSINTRIAVVDTIEEARALCEIEGVEYTFLWMGKDDNSKTKGSVHTIKYAPPNYFTTKIATLKGDKGDPGTDGTIAFPVMTVSYQTVLNAMISELNTGKYTSNTAVVIVVADFGTYKKGDLLVLTADGSISKAANIAGEKGTDGIDGKDAYYLNAVSSQSDIDRVVGELKTGIFSGDVATALVTNDFGDYKVGDVLWITSDGSIFCLFNTKGDKGDKGASITVEKVSSSDEDGGSNIVRFSDGVEVIIKNGKDGYTPQKGVDYFDGKDGADGKDGYTPQKGVDYFDGKDGVSGKDGYSVKPYNDINKIFEDVAACTNKFLYVLWTNATNGEIVYTSGGADPQEKRRVLKLGDIWSITVQNFAIYDMGIKGNIRGADGSGGDISEEALAAAIEEYFIANPIIVPKSLSDLKDDANHRTVTDSEKATWSAKENAGTAASKVSIHNTATDAHNDIRLLIEGLTTRLNALADSDDTTLDQMSEIVAYIKSNKSLIDDITTKKVNVTDIIDNLTTNVANKPLSAAQGVALKSLIDEIYATIGDINTILESI